MANSVPNRAHDPKRVAASNSYAEIQRFMDTHLTANTPVSEMERNQKSPVGEYEQEGHLDQGISGDALANLRKYPPVRLYPEGK